MKYTLRDYQEKAVQKMLWAMDLPGNDIVCVAQGGGKSLIIADFAHTLGKPILILCPNREILTQNKEKLSHYVDKSEIGIYSASLDRKDISTFTLGTIQSMYKRPELFKDFDVAIVDECDLVPMNKMSMYGKFFKSANIKKIFGTTGTPWRMDTYYEEPSMGWSAYHQRKAKGLVTPIRTVTTTKMINRYSGGFWERMLYVLNTKELLDMGYLSPLKYLDTGSTKHEDVPMNKTESDFDLEAFERQRGDKMVLNISLLVGAAINIHDHILVFCSSVAQAETLSEVFPTSAVVTANTKKKDRQRIIKEFKEGKIPVVFNVSVLTVGFDFPELDCIILARPSRSLRLHLQILGRGTRIAEGKEFCQIIDLSGNVSSLGELEEIEVKKINGGWNVVSPARPEGFHGKPLYDFIVEI